MRHYEVTFIVDPVLSGDDLTATAQSYINLIEKEGGKIIHVDEMGLRELAYPINNRQSGVYYCMEFAMETGDFIGKLELTLKRDDQRIMRYLTVALDKFGIKYNEDKRAGKIGKRPKTVRGKKNNHQNAPAEAAPAAAPAPEAVAVAAEKADATPTEAN